MQKATSLQRTQVFLSYTLFLAKVAHVYVIDFVLFNHIPKLFNKKKEWKSSKERQKEKGRTIHLSRTKQIQEENCNFFTLDAIL